MQTFFVIQRQKFTPVISDSDLESSVLGMSSKAPPPIPEEYKGRSPAPPPPPQGSPSRSRPNSTATKAPPAPPRQEDAPRPRPGSHAAQRPASLKRSGSQANRPPPPTPNMAEYEDAKHARPMPRPPELPKEPQGELDSLEAKQPFLKRKVRQYREKVRQCQKSQHALERAVICTIAIGLLWLTCLSLCRSVVTFFIIPPGSNRVIAAAKQSMDVVEEQKVGYSSCANRITTECKRRIENGITVQKNETLYAQLRNRKLLDDLYGYRDRCHLELHNGLLALQLLQELEGGQDPQALFPGTAHLTNDARCSLVDEMLKGGQGGIQALGATDRYASDADQQVSRGLSAYDARRSYDSEYAKNKTDQILGNGTFEAIVNATEPYFGDINKTYDTFMACTSPTKTYNNIVCPTESVLSLAEQMRQRAVTRYNQIKQQVEQWEARAKNIIDQINGFYQTLRDNAALRAAIDALLILQSLPTLDGMGFNLIGSILLSLNMGSLVNVDVNQMFAQYEAEAQAYVYSVVQQQQIAAEKYQELLLAQATFPDITGNYLEDYNPPNLTTEEAREAWAQDRNQTLNNMSSALNNTINKGQEQVEVFAAEINTTDPRNFSSTFLQSVERRIITFVAGDVDVDAMDNAWNELINLATTFDILYRVFRTLQLIRKYWKVSAIDLPPADVRTDHMQNKGLAYGQRNTGQQIASCVAHPATACVAMGIMTGVIVSLLISLYLPIYTNFVRGCKADLLPGGGINDSIIDTGTMVTRNAYAISLKYASGEGDKTTTVEVDKINARKEVACKSELDTSQQILTEHEKEYNFILSSHRDLQYQAFTLRDCLDIPAIQINRSTLIGTATGNNMTNMNQAIPGPNCAYDFPELETALFNCSKVTCSFQPCVGVADDHVAKVTWRAGCYAEWHIHATFLTIIMVTVMFILINISRILTMRGLVRVYWRYLTDGRFSYLGTCERSGDLKYPTIITEKGYSMKRAVRESLASRLKWWESKSFMILLFGIGVNIPWIGVLVFLNQTMTVMEHLDD